MQVIDRLAGGAPDVGRPPGSPSERFARAVSAMKLSIRSASVRGELADLSEDSRRGVRRRIGRCPPPADRCRGSRPRPGIAARSGPLRTIAAETGTSQAARPTIPSRAQVETARTSNDLTNSSVNEKQGVVLAVAAPGAIDEHAPDRAELVLPAAALERPRKLPQAQAPLALRRRGHRIEGCGGGTRPRRVREDMDIAESERRATV